MTVVVSDTSPVRALSQVGHLDWLAALFARVIVPPAVVRELQHPLDPLRAVDVPQVGFLEIIAPRDEALVREYCRTLDRGEAEALALATQLQAELILIDELDGRQAAAAAGFRVLGTLGILLLAKERQLCAAVAPLIERLQRESRFFIAPELRSAILLRAGESDEPRGS